MNNCPTVLKFTKVGSQYCQILNKPVKFAKGFNIFPKVWNFARSGHTDYNHFDDRVVINDHKALITNVTGLKIKLI